MAGAIHPEPSMDNAVSNSQRGRNEPVSIRGHRRILAQVQRQFREDGTLDFVKVVLPCGRGSGTRREIGATSMVRGGRPRVASELRLIHAHASYAAIGAWLTRRRDRLPGSFQKLRFVRTDVIRSGLHLQRLPRAIFPAGFIDRLFFAGSPALPFFDIDGRPPLEMALPLKEVAHDYAER